MSAWRAQLPEQTSWRPLAHVAVRDDEVRSRVTIALRREGWAVVDSPSGYHMLQSIAGPLFGAEPWCKPKLVVVDAFSPGCSGLTIAHGLRDLGWSIPVVLVVSSAETLSRVAEDTDNWIYVADRQVAAHTAVGIAKLQTRSEHAHDWKAKPSDETEEDPTEHMSTWYSAGDRRVLA